MTTLSLLLTSLLLTIPIFISYKEKLGLEKDILISITRAILQLLLVGYILEFIFGIHNPFATTLLVVIIIFNASLNIRKRGGQITKAFRIAFLSNFVGTLFTMVILIASGAISFTPNEVIPVSGMIVSNAMVAIALSFKSLNTLYDSKRNEVEVKLSLGCEPKDASKEIIRDSIKLAIQPTVDSAKSLGIVALPGMMTGLILAGTSPLVAIKFQIMVTFMILASSSIAVMLSTIMSYKSFFTERKQLVLKQKYH